MRQSLNDRINVEIRVHGIEVEEIVENMDTIYKKKTMAVVLVCGNG